MAAIEPDPTNRPDLIVDTPPSRPAERGYALSVLLGDWLGLRHVVRVDDTLTETRIRLAGNADGPFIVLPDVLLSPATSWLSRESLPGATPTGATASGAILPTVDAPTWAGIDGRCPLLFSTRPGGDGLLQVDGDRFEFRLDLLGSLFFLLSRYEEYVEPADRDARGRFPARSSALGRAGLLETPILDLYLRAFVGLLGLAWPAFASAAGEHWTESGGVVVSHDVDHPSASARWRRRQRLRVLAGDAIHRRDVGLAFRRAASFIPTHGTIARFDPFNTFDFLMTASEGRGLRSTFFFITRDTEVPDGSVYRVDDPWARRLIREISDRGHRIGLHGSYLSYDDAGRMADEWSRLAAACSTVAPGVLRRAIRQHFLLWRPGVTWRAQATAGLTEDETLGFADAVGYRAGTARSFEAFDVALGRPLDLRVRPLHVMDVTLLQHMSIGLEKGLAIVAEMARRTRRYGGDLSVLWHNSSLESARAKALYLRLLDDVIS